MESCRFAPPYAGAGMADLAVPDDVTWELVVVNNRCTDATDEVIASFADRLPIRRAWEPEPGLSNARNRAVAEAAGAYIVFTDDDVHVDQDWLAAYARAFRRWPDADVFGGPIVPLFEDGPPEWIPRVMDRVGAVFGQQSFGDAPVQLTPECVDGGPYGGNMAMRTKTLRGRPFDRALGVRAGRYSIGEETDWIRAVLRTGSTGWWTPEPRVQHCVPPSAQTLDHVRRWMVGCGRYIASVPGLDPTLSQDRPLGLYARFLRYEVRFRLRRFFAPPEAWIRDMTRASQTWGRILERRERGAEP
jgi:glucosyl-dolichyl phosphate glucuronosyltransferase